MTLLFPFIEIIYLTCLQVCLFSFDKQGLEMEKSQIYRLLKNRCVFENITVFCFVPSWPSATQARASMGGCRPPSFLPHSSAAASHFGPGPTRQHWILRMPFGWLCPHMDEQCTEETYMSTSNTEIDRTDGDKRKPTKYERLGTQPTCEFKHKLV